jgi:DNA-binding IclR family transcriptional regulator
MYHCTALGKAFMSMWDEPMRRTVYRLRGLEQQTENTITDVDTLEAQLARFLELGYAIDEEENEPGVNGIGVAMVNGLGRVAAAISVCGPSNRLTREMLDEIAPDVLKAANLISVAIGGAVPPDKQKSRKRG